jgi:hypothetical protein
MPRRGGKHTFSFGQSGEEHKKFNEKKPDAQLAPEVFEECKV